MRMTAEATPPLLRGIGTLLILVASAVAVVEAEDDVASPSLIAIERPSSHANSSAQRPEAAALAEEVRLLRAEIHEDTAAERVLENRWIQLLGLLGTALIAVSFLTEAMQKRRPR